VQLRAAILALLAAGPLWPAQQIPVFHGGIDLVHLGVTVTDRKGNLVTDLTGDDFEVVEDGRAQTIAFFSSGLDAGPDALHTHLGLLVDVSESMGDDISFTKTAAVKFLNSLQEAVDITLIDFDTEVRTTRYGQSDFARLIERIRQQKAKGNTALYDAIGVYLTSTAGQDGRKVMLVYTDGGDTTSSMTFADLYNLLKASDATVYAIGELEHQSSLTRSDQRMRLQQIAEATGGRAFFPVSVKDLDHMYEQVLAEVRAQYTIGYAPTSTTTDGAWRKVEVKAKRKDVRVRSRKGYFGPYKK
jgi:Ca-activated chloride channel family protein